jgi:hypothetical protein
MRHMNTVQVTAATSTAHTAQGGAGMVPPATRATQERQVDPRGLGVGVTEFVSHGGILLSRTGPPIRSPPRSKVLDVGRLQVAMHDALLVREPALTAPLAVPRALVGTEIRSPAGLTSASLREGHACRM